MNVTRTTLREALGRWARGIARACRWRHDGAVMPGGNRRPSPVIRLANVLGVLVLSAGLLFFARTAPAAIALDNTSSGGGADQSSLTWAHTTGSGTDRLLVVGVAIRNPAGQNVSSVTYNGVALTSIGTGVTNGTIVRARLYYLVAPPTGTFNVVVTLTAGTFLAAGAASFSGVDQTTPVEASNGATGTGLSPSVSVTTLTDNAWVVDALSFRRNSEGAGAPTATPTGSGQTSRWSAYGESANDAANVRSRGSTIGPKTPAGSTTMSWTLSGSPTNQDWAHFAAALKPASPPAAGSSRVIFNAAANSPLLSNLTSGSWSHTTGGTNRYLVVGLAGYDSVDPLTSVTVTYAGVAMTKLGGIQSGNTDTAILWGLVNPALGTNTVQVSNIPAGYSQLGGGSVSFTGVHQTAPTGTLVSTAYPTTGTVNITLAEGDLGVDILYSSGNAVGTPPVPGANETARTSQTTGGSTYFRMGTEAGSGTVTMNWTGGSTTDNAITAIPLKPAPSLAASGSTINGTTVVFNVPAGTVNGDLLVASLTVATTNTANIPLFTDPDGWTLVRETIGGYANTKQRVLYRVASGEPASYTWTINYPGDIVGAIQSYSGIDTANPVDVHGSQANASSATVTAPSITTTVANTTLVGIFSMFYRSPTYTPPAGMTERYDITTLFPATAVEVAAMSADEPRAAIGATGTRVATGTKAEVNIGMLLALRPNNKFLVEAAGGGSIGAQISGTSFNIRITALDGNNNTLTSFTGTVTITSTGTLSAGGGVTAAFTAGVLASRSVTISNTGTFTITATATGGADFGTSNTFTVNTVQPSFISGYSFRRLLDVTDGLVSSGPHANFPMLVCFTLADLRTTANGGKVTDAQGDDIVFTDINGTTQLSHQVEKYDATTGEIIAWVRVPSLAATSQIYIYYGNAAVTTFQGSVPGSVWDSNFQMVHHLSETSGQHQDSTSNGRNSTSVSVTTQGSATGKINRADVFTAASSNMVQVASSTAFDIGAGSITVEAWVKTSSTALQFIVNRKTDAGSGWQLIMGNTTAGAPEFWVYDDTPGTAGHKAQANSATAVSNNAFRYLVGRWTGGSKLAEIIVDGVVIQSATAPSFVPVTNTRPLVIGAEGDTTPGFYFGGTLDEVRFSNSARSNGWIVTSYNNMNSCATFCTVVGAEESSLAAPGHFNAVETGTAAGAILGVIYTKITGVAVSLDMIALNPQKNAVLTTFTGTVKVEVLDASNNSAAIDANGCRSSWTVIHTLSSVAFTDGRDPIGSFTVAKSYPNARLRISYPTWSPTQIGCSTDNFAIRPTAFTVTTSAATGGTAASQTGTSGSPAIKAGASFNLTATAVAGYNGTPAIDNTAGRVAGTPTQGTIGGGFGAAAAATGIATGNSFTYSEVGNFGLNANAVRDTTFTNVDQAAGDCVASSTSNTLSGGKYGCWVGSTATAATAFGRFIPDNFLVTYTTPPVFAPACGAFAYVGTKFTYPTAVMTVTARNSSNATTTNYAGSYVKMTIASLNQAPYNTQALRYTRYDALGGGTTPALDHSALPATSADPSVGTFTNGVGTLTFASGATGLGFTRSTTTPNAPFNADIALALNVIDTDGVVFAGNPASFGAATANNGIAFLSGKSMRFGRLVVRNANGSQLLPLPVRVEAQYWSGAPTNAFITNTLDNCTSIASANEAMGNYTGNLGACETAISGGGALNMGRRTLQLAAPGSGNTGSVILTVNLGASASGNTCTAVGAGPGAATTAANLPHLQGNWTGANYDQNPTARATFGVFGGANEVIFVRENF